MAFRNASHTQIDYLYAVDNSRSGESEWEHLMNAACLGAGHQSEERYDAPKCHPKTRKAVIKDIMSWIDSKDQEKRIMWLNAPAGAGKSAIAQTVAEKCDEEGKLISSFFFSRTASGTGRDDGLKLVPTLAYQLGVQIRRAKEIIIEGLEENEAVLTYAMEKQMEHLVVRPLSAVLRDGNRDPIPHMVIIDGFDECKNPDMQSRIIQMNAKTVSRSPRNLWFLVASRPELEIRNTFNDDIISRLCLPLTLDDKYEPGADIYRFLRSEFITLKRKHTLASTLLKRVDWPPAAAVTTLVERSSGQFIYASTAIKYIAERRRNPLDGLSMILRAPRGDGSPYTQLDALYDHILTTAVKGLGSYGPILQIFQVLVLIKDATGLHTPWEMARFLGTTVPNLLLTLSDLHSILEIPVLDDDDLECRERPDIRFLHASFSDFLKDPVRSKRFHVSDVEAHVAIGDCCFNTISRYIIGSGVVHETIPTLYYAYRCLIYHINRSNFHQPLIERLLSVNDSDRQALYRGLVINTFSGSEFNYDTLCLFYKFDITAHNLYDSATPLNELIHAIFWNLPLEVADDRRRDQTCHTFYGCIQAIGYLMKRRCDFEVSDVDINLCLLGEMLETPLRAGDAYLDDTKSEAIFRGAWSYLSANVKLSTEASSHDDSDSESSETDIFWNGSEILLESVGPACYEYLLNRARPSYDFKTLVQTFSQSFETCFYKTWNGKPDDRDFVTNSISSLMKVVDTFIKECELIERRDSVDYEYYMRKVPPMDKPIVISGSQARG